MPASKIAYLTQIEQPYPGLRPFDLGDAHLFFGREQHTQELLDRLSRNRFLAVVGTSGSGKSSLVRAGLMPALYRGYLLGATTLWRIAVMRPGGGPLREMAKALSSKEALNTDAGELRERLAASSLGFVSAVRAADLAPGTSLLLIVDQFEELFRFASERRAADSTGESLLFVASLLEAVDQIDVPIYVVLTMRTDFLGNCTLFPGLPEALNRSQYLIPRLTRDQRRDAINRPVEIAGAEIAPRLIQQILNDMGDDPDQLPVMQHALARTYRLWKKKNTDAPIDLDDYLESGTTTAALDQHAQSIYDGLSEQDREWTRRLLRCLTKMENGLEVRRPGRLGRIFRVIGAGDEAQQRAVLNIVETYANEENSLLFVSPESQLDDRIVDISHESLIRKWRQLSRWVKEEAESAEWFKDLVRDTRRQAVGEADFWNDPELGRVLSRRTKDGWTPAWAEQYGCGTAEFGAVETFLEHSRKKERNRKLIRRAAWAGVALLAILGVVLFRQWEKSSALADQNDKLRNQLEKLSAENAAVNNDRVRQEKIAQTATGEQRAQALEKLNDLNKTVIESLQKENAVLKVQIAGAGESKSAAAPADQSSKIRALENELATYKSKVQPYEPQLKEKSDTENKSKQPVGAAGTVTAQTSPPLTVDKSNSGQPPQTANAAPTGPLVINVPAENAVRIPGTELTLMLANYGLTAEDVLLYVMSEKGQAAGAVGAFLADRISRRSSNLLKTMSSMCNSDAFEWNKVKAQCFTIEGKKIDKKDNRTQQLGRIVLGDVPFDLKVVDLKAPAREGEKYSVTLELRPVK